MDISKLNPFAIGGLLLSLSCGSLVIINVLFGRKKIHYIWSLFNLSVAIWGFGAYKVGVAINTSDAWLWWKINHIGVIWMPVFILHTILILCNIDRRKLLYFVYSQGIAFSLLDIFSNTLFFEHLRFVFGSFYYTKSKGLIYPIFFIIWIGLVFYGTLLLIKTRRIAKGFKRSQINYFLLGMVVGFVGGITNFFPHFGIMVYPFGNFTIPLYSVIVTYAIIKHHLMDIKIAITRTGIFLAVYTLVLGIPFVFGYKLLGRGIWFVVLLLGMLFASLGPFIYQYLRRKTEDILLAEQLRYQKALKEFAPTLIHIRDSGKLTTEVTSKIMKSMNIQFVAFYLQKDNQFYLSAFKTKDSFKFPSEIDSNSEFTVHPPGGQKGYCVIRVFPCLSNGLAL